LQCDGTALTVASSHGHSEVVEILIKNRANVNLLTKVSARGHECSTLQSTSCCSYMHTS